MKYIYAVFIITLYACNNNGIRSNGYTKPCDFVNKIYVNEDVSQDVETKFGIPSYIDNENKVYYYIGLAGKDDALKSFKPIKREMLMVYFDNSGKVLKTECDIKDFTFVKK